MDEATVALLYEEWARAIAERDAAAIDRLFDPSYSYTSPFGERLERQEMIELEMRLPPPQLPIRDLSVQPVGEDVTIVRGRVPLKGDFPRDIVSPDLVERIREGIEIAFTSVWRRVDGRWRVLSNDAHIVGG